MQLVSWGNGKGLSRSAERCRSSNYTHQTQQSNPADTANMKAGFVSLCKHGRQGRERQEEDSPPTTKGQQAGKRKDGGKRRPIDNLGTIQWTIPAGIPTTTSAKLMITSPSDPTNLAWSPELFTLIGAVPNTAWQAGPYGACSTYCGGGKAERTVACVEVDTGNVVSDGLCNAAMKPALDVPCNIHACKHCPQHEYTDCACEELYELQHEYTVCVCEELYELQHEYTVCACEELYELQHEYTVCACEEHVGCTQYTIAMQCLATVPCNSILPHV
eukprot:358784-Chlamydomonas_euryale.AAC.10